MLRSFR